MEQANAKIYELSNLNEHLCNTCFKKPLNLKFRIKKLIQSIE